MRKPKQIFKNFEIRRKFCLRKKYNYKIKENKAAYDPKERKN